MIGEIRREYRFLVPVVRDGNRVEHEPWRWRFLKKQLVLMGGGYTVAPGLHSGEWLTDDGNVAIGDDSRQIIVSLDTKQEPALEALLGLLCRVFGQQCIYLADNAGCSQLIDESAMPAPLLQMADECGPFEPQECPVSP